LTEAKAPIKKDNLWHDKTLIAVCVEAAVLMMGMGHLNPAIPIFVEALGVEQAQIGLMIGLVFAAYGMARAIMDVPAGTLARRWGRSLS
jgi:MFS family permease